MTHIHGTDGQESVLTLYQIALLGSSGISILNTVKASFIQGRLFLLPFFYIRNY